MTPLKKRKLKESLVHFAFWFEPINSWADASEGLLCGEQHLRGGADDEDLRGGAGASNATKKKRWWY